MQGQICQVKKTCNWWHNGWLKTNFNNMLFGTKQKLKECDNFEIKICGKSMDREIVFEYFGVILDESMSWKEHIENLSENVSKRLNMFHRIRPCLTIKAAKCIFNTLLQPLLDYTYTVWGNLGSRGVPSGGGVGVRHTSHFFRKCLVNWYKIDIGLFLKPKWSVNLEFMVVTSYLTFCCQVIFTCIKLY